MDRDKRDPETGAETTGHEWDGIYELNKPLPKWWLYVFYATIVWAIGYWLLMPAWPLLSTHSKGFLGYSERERVAGQIEAAKAEKAVYRERIAESDLETINEDPELLRFALAGGEAAFGDNCAPCHGRGAQGAFGYPNLRDDAWLWGGTLEDIQFTILHGIRAEDPKTRGGEMPAFGRTGVLAEPQIKDVTEFVLSLSGRTEDGEAAKRGAEIYAASCAACHGAEGKGNQVIGAPDLTDDLWLYAGDEIAIAATIRNGRAGMMPAWAHRLDRETIKELAIYVHALGGGQ
jgi:cytochrome c oxidase cbb3-type subunit III